MTNTEIKTHLHNSAEVMFDNLIMAFDEDITLPTAALLAKELGIVNYDPRSYDH